MTTTAAATASVRSRSVSFLGCLAPDLAAFFPSAELAEAACAARRAAAMKSGLPVPGSGMTGGFGSEAASAGAMRSADGDGARERLVEPGSERMVRRQAGIDRGPGRARPGEGCIYLAGP